MNIKNGHMVEVTITSHLTKVTEKENYNTTMEEKIFIEVTEEISQGDATKAVRQAIIMGVQKHNELKALKNI